MCEKRKVKEKSSLFSENIEDMIYGSSELENNMFFDEYQIRHFYQSATEKVHYEIKNIFIAINDDQQKLTRSSLARGTKFDNSILQNYMNKEKYKNNVKS